MAFLAHRPRADRSSGPRHLEPGPGCAERVAASTGTGRHAEPQWTRLVFDARRDGDPLDWLGFAAAAP